MALSQLLTELHQLADDKIAAHSQRFFKTGKGEYGEGDQFIGIRVPKIRKLARKYQTLSIPDILELLNSPIHEERLLAIVIMVEQYKRGDADQQKGLFKLYLGNTHRINNWDLIDVSVHHIVGHYLEKRDKSILYRWAESKNLWERRMAVMATFYFIRQHTFVDTLRIGEVLVHDQHDLIHKAVGWMLREVGNRDLDCEEAFLMRYYKTMPRTMLRYAIEKFEEKKRKQYLKGEIAEDIHALDRYLKR